MLAETVSLDGGTLLFVLVILLLLLAVSVAVLVFGFILAPKAGRGSGTALGLWIVILVLEGLACLSSLAALLDGAFTLWAIVLPVIIGAQVMLFVQARRGAG